MQEAGFFEQQRRLSPTGLAVVISLHAAGITALVLAKGPEITKGIIPPTIVRMIEVPTDPPPDIPPPPPQDRPVHQQTRVDVPRRNVEIPTDGPVVVSDPMPTPTWTSTPPGPDVVVEPVPQPQPPPQPPAPPRVLEPARARGSLQGLFRPDDYPVSAAEAEAQGSTGVRLSIGTDGRVTACSVTRSSGSRALDTATCSVLRSRARYTPARDQNDQAVADTQNATITWRLTGG